MEVNNLGYPQEKQVRGSPEQTPKVDRPDQDLVETPKRGKGGLGEDSIQISEEARKAAQTQTIAQDEAAVPEVRPEKVEEAKRFLEAELYNDQGILEQTAQKLGHLFQA